MAGADRSGRPAPPVLGHRAPLGAACVPAKGSAGLDPCGAKGRVSLELDGATTALLRAASCELTELEHQSVYAPNACLSEGVLYAGAICFACRLMDAGWSAKALVRELTREQSLELQKRLGLDTTRPLGTEAEWRAAIEAAKKK